MAETPEEKFEQISRAVRESILRNYPNPERRGCPGDAVVLSVAARTELQADDVWEHITHCSPCYAELLACKYEFRKKRQHKVRVTRRTLIGLTATAAVAVPVAIVSRRDDSPGQGIVAEWDLEGYAPTRSIQEEQNRPPFRAPLKSGRIRARLPLGTDEGTYQIEIRRTEEGPALKTTTGNAQIVAGHTTLTFQIDLSNLPAGRYFAAIGGRGKSWRVQPLVLQ
ncbi:MAG TPA: hypothetical protein VNH18_34705 [Bryobacteraceae bacterium]|nr:hypothetical protein [Bryobacteraceae bacterium]